MKETTAAALTNIFSSRDIIEELLAISAQGLMVVNLDGIIIYANKSFEQIHGVCSKHVLGKPVTQVIENTRMHIVAQTRVAETDQIQTIGGHDYVVSRVPLVVGGECIGIAGKIRFRDTRNLKDLTRKIQKLEDPLKRSEDRHHHTRYAFTSMAAFSEVSHNIKQTAIRASGSRATVLLLGESGVGKEAFAQSIHNMSPRQSGPFVMLNCSAIQENLFESELFGDGGGAFIGARKQGRKGKFELADTGTLFLDEIGDMPLNSQARLLRVIQEKTIDKVGGEKVYDVDVRIIASTSKDLEQRVRQEKFRKDLFYRINVISIYIPPLRERPTDISQLTLFLWKQLKQEYGIYHKKLSYEAMNILQNYNWPGNIRELRNVLERLMVLVHRELITPDHVKTIIAGSGRVADPGSGTRQDLRSLVAQTEKKAISQALVASNANRSRAAKSLGISRALLYKKMHLYEMMEL